MDFLTRLRPSSGHRGKARWTGDVESRGLNRTASSSTKAQHHLGKPQGGRGNAWRHYTGLESLPVSSASKHQDAEPVSELPPKALKLALGPKERSFWERAHSQLSWPHKQFKLLKTFRDTFRVSKKPPTSPIPGGEKSQGDEDLQGGKVDDGREEEKGGPPSTSGNGGKDIREATSVTVCNSSSNGKSDQSKPLQQQSGLERLQSSADEKVLGLTVNSQEQPHNWNSPPAEPQKSCQSQDKRNVTDVYTSRSPGPLQRVWRHHDDPLPEETTRSHQTLKPGKGTPAETMLRHPGDTPRPDDAAVVVAAQLEHKPSLKPVREYSSTASEGTSTISDHMHQANTTFFQARKPLGPHDSEAAPPPVTELSGDSADLGDFESDQNRELHERRFRSKQQRRSEQQDRYPTLTAFTEWRQSLKKIS